MQGFPPVESSNLLPVLKVNKNYSSMLRILTAGRVDGSPGSSVAADAHAALNPVNPVVNWVMYVCLHVYLRSA